MKKNGWLTWGVLMVCLSAHCADVDLRAGLPAVQSAAVPLNSSWRLQEALVGAGLTLSPPEPFNWVFSPGEPVRLKLKGDPDTMIDRTVLVTIWDWYGNPVYQSAPALPVDESLCLNVSGRGTWLITVDLMKGGALESRLARSVAVLPSNERKRELWSSRSGFFLGSCLFPSRYGWKTAFGKVHPVGLTPRETFAKELMLDARLGMALERIDCDYLLVDNSLREDFPIDYSRLDRVVETISDAGFELAIQIGPLPWMGRPDYLEQGHAFWFSPPQSAAYDRLAREFLMRYSEYAAFFEVMNEPDNRHFWVGTGKEYVDLFELVSHAHRKLDSGRRTTAPVLIGGMTPLKAPDVKSEEDMVKRARMQEIISGTINASQLSFHAHGTLERVRKHMTILREMCAEAGRPDIPFVQTEGGISAWNLEQEKVQAVTLLQKLFYAWANNTEGWLVYATRWHGGPRVQIPGGQGGTPSGWGILDYNFCPRFAYGAIGAFADWYAGATFNRKLIESDTHFVYEFKQGEDLLVSSFVMLGDNGSAPQQSFLLGTDADRILWIDFMGNVVKETNGGTVEVISGIYPLTLRLIGGSSVELY